MGQTLYVHVQRVFAKVQQVIGRLEGKTMMKELITFNSDLKRDFSFACFFFYSWFCIKFIDLTLDIIIDTTIIQQILPNVQCPFTAIHKIP